MRVDGHRARRRRRAPTGSSCCPSRSASPCSSPRGTSRPRWRPARSARRSPPAAPCVLKPARDTPLTALAIGRLLAEAGVPGRRRQRRAVAALRRRSSTAMLHDPGCASCPSPARPRWAASCSRAASDSVVNCSMELGGNAPFIVLDDADLDAAVAGAMVAKMRNGGEACTAANRFYVHEPVADEFSRRLGRRDGAPPRRAGSRTAAAEVGPLINERRPRQGRRTGRRRRRHGARRVAGAAAPLDRPGCFYPPTVLAERRRRLTRSSRRRSSARSPRSSASTTDDEAIGVANDTEYGLVAYVYTGDLAAGCGSPRRSRAAWSASTAAWSPIRPRRSAA